MNMDKQHHKHGSHLFTVRVWQEDLGNDQLEWRGKVQHVHSGEALYFREWTMLVTSLLKMLAEPANPESHPYEQ